jgi:hypothetical protein
MHILSGKCEVKPGQGIGPLNLNMNRNEIKAILGKGSSSDGNSEFYINNAIQIDYEGGKAKFIEVSDNKKVIPVYKNIALLQTKADKIIELFNRDWSFNKKDPELGCSYQYPGVVFWREDDPKELIKELKEIDPKNTSKKAFFLKEIERFSFFQTVAVFVKGYYD